MGSAGGSDDLARGGHGSGTALLLHGAGSTGDFVRRAFADPLAAAGLRVVAPQARRPPATAEHHLADLDDLVRRLRPVVVGGVSRGAHLVALWAAAAAGAGAGAAARPDHGVRGLVLALPAWTGPPEEVASLSGLAADDLDRAGTDVVLARARRAATGWVADELHDAWPTYPPGALAADLRAVASSRSAEERELRAVTLPVGVVALQGDPFHPAAVARTWASTLPRASLRTVALAAPAADRRVLGRAAVAALRAVGGLRDDEVRRRGSAPAPDG